MYNMYRDLPTVVGNGHGRNQHVVLTNHNLHLRDHYYILVHYLE